MRNRQVNTTHTLQQDIFSIDSISEWTFYKKPHFFSKWSLKVVYDNGTVQGTVPVGESCTGNTGDLEKCERPEIPVCVDRNKYCTGPPVVIRFKILIHL